MIALLETLSGESAYPLKNAAVSGTLMIASYGNRTVVSMPICGSCTLVPSAINCGSDASKLTLYPLDGGNLMKSVAMVWKGCTLVSVVMSCKGGLLGCVLLLSCWQMPYPCMYFF